MSKSRIASDETKDAYKKVAVETKISLAGTNK